jgi:hypothetical protein
VKAVIAPCTTASAVSCFDLFSKWETSIKRKGDCVLVSPSYSVSASLGLDPPGHRVTRVVGN